MFHFITCIEVHIKASLEPKLCLLRYFFRLRHREIKSQGGTSWLYGGWCNTVNPRLWFSQADTWLCFFVAEHCEAVVWTAPFRTWNATLCLQVHVDKMQWFCLTSPSTLKQQKASQHHGLSHKMKAAPWFWIHAAIRQVVPYVSAIFSLNSFRFLVIALKEASLTA